MNNLHSLFQTSAVSRRAFLSNTLKSAGSLALLGMHSSLAVNTLTAKQLTVQEIMDLILKEGGLTPLSDTVDTLKAGRDDQVVTGIVTTMFPTITIVEEAAKRNANFIIAHEPSFYNHKDDPAWVPNNTVLKQKQQLLEKHKIAIWRFHDYCHSMKPDAVSYGVAKKANWLSYYKTGERMLTIPKLSLKQLVQHLKTSLGIGHVRVIGNLDQSCSRIALLPGAWGGPRQVSTVESEKPDVLIVGELSEWETAEYIRDGRLLGSKTALIVLGHAVSEEPGMQWFAEWLQPKLTGIKVTHLASGDPFIWM
ncbi:Nif3-like dinuclear metal center hexameric protein [Cytophagaceae bacterium DM2B3-1]|uniref:Nif3-like dinuclear metal center hexameric protein n=1 Tax=Xanthocytophaga flava TaxID=3048013 RepID=A0ABT7CFV2_9BACT|nr:Nif3-like dinuclear metal center hexameric protein [Xanthocytophaga flavus]MDJ1492595.1 Nif3-like dinuclear metal center hexameric protein [Xanthocytophaga flavus]